MSNIVEMFCIPKESPRYSEGALEIRNALVNLLQKIEMLLYTEKGSVLCMPDYGINLEQYIFETNVSGQYIESEIKLQIMKYVLSKDDNQFGVDVKVTFHERINAINSYMCVVDIYISNNLMSSYLF